MAGAAAGAADAARSPAPDQAGSEPAARFCMQGMQRTECMQRACRPCRALRSAHGGRVAVHAVSEQDTAWSRRPFGVTAASVHPQYTRAQVTFAVQIVSVSWPGPNVGFTIPFRPLSDATRASTPITCFSSSADVKPSETCGPPVVVVL